MSEMRAIPSAWSAMRSISVTMWITVTIVRRSEAIGCCIAIRLTACSSISKRRRLIS